MSILFSGRGQNPDRASGAVARSDTSAVSGVVFADDLLRVLWLSPELRDNVVAATHLTDLVSPADEDVVRRSAEAVRSGARQIAGVRLRVRAVHGARWVGEAFFEGVGPTAAPGSVMVTFHASMGEPADEVEGADRSEDVNFRAGHDQLTALPNRWTLTEALTRLLETGPSGVAAALLIDLDRLKVVNDSLGHEAGDRLLVEVAARLRSAVPDAGIVARIGGDEFVVLLDGMDAEFEVTQVAEQILGAMRPPVLIEERRHVVTASIGIVFIEDATDSAEVLSDADTAMYEAKAQGRDRFSVFDELLRVRAVSRFDVEEDLRRALAAGELCVHYQPQVSLETGRIVSAEALVRWEHPEHGLIFPGAFIGIAEETGLVKDIGELVLAEACEAAVDFQRRSRLGEPIGVSVNLSPRQLDETGIAGAVRRSLQENALSPHTLTLELTENALVADDPNVVLSLARLRDLGVRLAIDDFGTGYSSLSYLSRIPAHELKIDRSFVVELDSAAGRSVVEGIIGLARGVGLSTVAEGVETEEQAWWLREMGCELIQGYLVARGMPRKKFARAIASDRARVYRPPE